LQSSLDGNLKRLLTRSQARQKQSEPESTSAADEATCFPSLEASSSDKRPAASKSAFGNDSQSNASAARKRHQQRTAWIFGGAFAGFFCLVALIIALSQSPEPAPPTTDPYRVRPPGGGQPRRSTSTHRPGAMPENRRKYLERGQQQLEGGDGELP
jgi:hypothetical protein